MPHAKPRRLVDGGRDDRHRFPEGVLFEIRHLSQRLAAAGLGNLPKTCSNQRQSPAESEPRGRMHENISTSVAKTIPPCLSKPSRSFPTSATRIPISGSCCARRKSRRSSSRGSSRTSASAAQGRAAAPAVQHFSGRGRHVFHPLQNRRQRHGRAVADARGRGIERHRAARPRIHRAESRRRNSAARRGRLRHGGDVFAGATLAAKGHRLRRRTAARGYFVREGICRARLGSPRDDRGRQPRRKRFGHAAVAGGTSKSEIRTSNLRSCLPAARRRCSRPSAKSRRISMCPPSFRWTSTCAAASASA